MYQKHESGIYSNEVWSFTIIRVMSIFIINEERYDYKNPEENKHVLYNCLKYFRKKCE